MEFEIADNCKSISYGIKIKADLDERISCHIRALKILEGKGFSKQRWIQDAIKEKLQTAQKMDIEKIKSDRTLNFCISRYIHDELVNIIKMLKKLKIRTSKTEFFLEAITDKLAREEKDVKLLFQKMIKTVSEVSEPIQK